MNWKRFSEDSTAHVFEGKIPCCLFEHGHNAVDFFILHRGMNGELVDSETDSERCQECCEIVAARVLES